MGGHTIIDFNLVPTYRHGSRGVLLVQLAEAWQSTRSHPDLECTPILQVWWWVVLRVFAVGVASLPVGRRQTLIRLVSGVAVERLVGAPRDAMVTLHLVGPSFVARAVAGIDQDWAGKGVIEHGIGDQTAGVVRQPDTIISLKRRTVRTVYIVIRSSMSFELIGIERRNVASMILVEIGEPVVEVSGRRHLIRQVVLENASIALNAETGDCFDGDVLLPFPLGFVGLDGALESTKAVGTLGHVEECVIFAFQLLVRLTIGILEPELLGLERER